MSARHPCSGPRGLLVVLCVVVVLFLANAAGAQIQVMQTNLVSDLAGLARFQDANLVRPWGIAGLPQGIMWVSENGTGHLQAFFLDGTPGALVTVPPPPGAAGPSTPTGVVINEDTTSFKVTSGSSSGASVLVTATEDGTLAGWNPAVDANNAVIMVNNAASGAIYKGLTLAEATEGNPMLYATNFAAGQVEIYDKNWNKIKTFTDATVPAGYAPFGIQNLTNRDIWVTFVRKAADGRTDQPGAGNAVVDVFDLNGNLLSRFAQGTELNSPWGIANPNSGLGPLGALVLIGNKGDGHINVYDAPAHTFLGQATDSLGRPIALPGLWALKFNNQGPAPTVSITAQGKVSAQALRAIPMTRLFFVQGLNSGQDGLVGVFDLLRGFGGTTGGFALPNPPGTGFRRGGFSFGGFIVPR